MLSFSYKNLTICFSLKMKEAYRACYEQNFCRSYSGYSFQDNSKDFIS